MNSVPPAAEGLLRKRDIAQRLNVSIRTVENWVSGGRIPCIRIGRVSRFDWPAVRQALERYTTAAK